MFKNLFYLTSFPLVFAFVLNVWVAPAPGEVGNVFESVVIDPVRCDFCPSYDGQAGSDTEDYWHLTTGSSSRVAYSLYETGGDGPGSGDGSAFTDPSGWTLTARVKVKDTAGFWDNYMEVSDDTDRYIICIVNSGVYADRAGSRPIAVGSVNTSVYNTYQMIYDPAGDGGKGLVGLYINGDRVESITRAQAVDIDRPSVLRRVLIGDNDSSAGKTSDVLISWLRFELGQYVWKAGPASAATSDDSKVLAEHIGSRDPVREGWYTTVHLDDSQKLQPGKADDSIELLELRRIADPAPHQSLVFTDLELWNDTFYCTFRVGTGHAAVGDHGVIRIISSDDGIRWETIGELKITGHDLRDPKLSVTPDNQLMVTTVKRHHHNGKWTHQSLSYLSADGRTWEGPYEVGEENMWLWRTTWHNGRAYNIGMCTQGARTEKFVRLYQSKDGKKFETLVDRLFDKNYPNEHAMVYLPDDTAMCLLRRDMRTVIGADYAMLGTAKPPYTGWQWQKLNVKIGGPEMIRLPDGRLLACVRRYVNDLQYYPCRTELGWIDPETATYKTCLKLPSYDDTSYAGMVWHKGLLWVSYYSCHERGEGKANIYLAKIRVKLNEPIQASMPSDYGKFLAQHDIIYDSPGVPYNQRPGDNLIDGPLLGNGDIGAVAHGGPEAAIINVGKNDVWDRAEISFPREPFTQAELYEIVESGQMERLREAWSGHSYGRHCNPCPKPCGQIIMVNDDLKEADFYQRLSLHEAVLRSEFKNDSARADLSTFVSHPENLIVTRYAFEGDNPLSLKVELHRWDDNAKLGWRLDDDPEGVEYHSDPMPTKPTFGQDGRYFWVRYKFRADKMFPDGFEYVMLGTIKGAQFETSLADHRAVATVTGKPKDKVEIFVSVVTTRDAEHPLEEAKRLVDSALRQGYDQMVAAHKQSWNSYWKKSYIDLSDNELERYWYINRYLVNCANKRGKVAPALYGPWITNDWSRWHGDYHYNYNFMQTYWGIYTCNTPELGWPYYDYTWRILPMCQKEARDIYKMRGAKYPLTAYPNAMETNPYPCLPLDRSMCLSAFAVHNLITHYQYTLDDEFLRERAYPVMAECARFYQDFMKKEDGKYVIWPTVSPEHHGGITPQFRLNRNCTLDLALIKALLKETIKASELLQRDEPDRKVWIDMLANIADYPTTEIESGKVIVDVENAGHISYNIPVPAAPVFPAGDIGLHSEPDMYALARNTMEHIHTYSGDGFIMIPMAWMRLGMKEKVTVFKNWCKDRMRWRNGSAGYFSGWPSLRTIAPVMENVAITAVISEMLLQSYDGKIRLFPALPDEMNAGFDSLRTVGAFLVASEAEKGQVKYVKIKSLKGQTCTIYNPWTGKQVSGQDLTSGQALHLVQDADEIRFATTANHEYLLAVN